MACLVSRRAHTPTRNRIALFILLFLFLPTQSFAGTFVAFGPESYTRSNGSPVAVIKNFSVINPNTTYTLRIHNGGLEDDALERVSSSVFILNGAQIVGPNEFNQNVTLIEKPITLGSTNQLSVELRGKPGGGLIVEIIGIDNDPPTISATVSPLPNLAGWNNADVTVTFFCTDDISGISICPDPIIINAEGANQVISGTSVDLAGNSASVSVTINLDKTPPAILLTSPAADFATKQAAVTVSGTVTDQRPITEVTVNGLPISLVDSAFDVDLSLIEGENLLTVTATDIADNTATFTRTATLDTIAPQVTITTPANLSTFNTTVLTVTGTVDDPNATVTVNGISAPISNGLFTADLTLGEGTRFITAVASDPLGNTATANISVTIDTTPPRVIIHTPAEGATLFSSPITVTGMINDIVSGTVNGNNATVTVNGIPAIVSNRGFTAQGITLSSGTNTITAIGTDTAGNQAQATISVTLDTSVQAKIVSLSGDNQTGPIGTPLSSPLVVQLRNSLGSPIFNQPVTFTVTRNNGTLNTGQRTVMTNTDPSGKAEVTLKLGTYAGAGENRVEVTSSGFAGPVVFTATGSAGDAAGIHQVNESVFRGATNTALPQPLEVIVSDSGGNPVEGVPVTFTAVAGGGKVDNNPAVTVISNSDGKAHVTWILGPDGGIANNRVEATFIGNAGLPVTFVASGVIPGDPANTTFSGIVLTNTDQPIPGVTVSMEGTTLTTQTTDQGQFSLTGVPVGAIHLLIDPGTTTLPGEWPELMFEVNTIAGRDNTIGMPIQLLPLQGGEPISPVEGATLAVDNVAGFSLTIPPGTVTFPDGTPSGTVSVTQVHRDKVPMPPPNGLNPKIVFTIQPSGVIFDPPAPIVFPNVDGRAPGEIMNLYSFDHDLVQWVSVGTGSVTEDGTFIVSDPGVGIIKGGWHFPEPPEEPITILSTDFDGDGDSDNSDSNDDNDEIPDESDQFSQWVDGDPTNPPPDLSQDGKADIPRDFVPGPNPVPGLFDEGVDLSQTSDYGWRNINGELDFHPGIDVDTFGGENIHSERGGEVVAANGNTILIEESGGVFRIYEHLGQVDVSLGEMVSPNDVIGKGSSNDPNSPFHDGTSFSGHLHFGLNDVGPTGTLADRVGQTVEKDPITGDDIIHENIDLTSVDPR